MIRTLAAAGVAALLFAETATAQTVGIGTTRGGATAQVTAGISKIVSEHAGMQMRPQPMGGTEQYIPVVNAGELEFGVANMMQTVMAFKGTGLNEGQKNDNLRLVATMMVFETGLLVRKDSGLNSPADLRGKRVPHGFDSAKLFQFMMTALLANGGVSFNDVQRVPTIALEPSFASFKEGKVDVVIAAVGSAIVTELNASVPGGVKYLSLLNTPEAQKRTLDNAPAAYITTLQPAPGFVGLDAPANVVAFDYMLWAHKNVPDDVVYRVTKAMHEREKDLHDLGPLWRSHAAAKMSRDQGLPYHPGAIKLFKEKGIWAAGRPES